MQIAELVDDQALSEGEARYVHAHLDRIVAGGYA